jgi:hypothetical protein
MLYGDHLVFKLSTLKIMNGCVMNLSQGEKEHRVNKILV